MTDYFNVMSFNNLKFTGHCVSLTTPHTRKWYLDNGKKYTDINKEIIQQVDQSLDFAQFDNWTGNSTYTFTNSADGKVDWVCVIYRNISSDFPSSPIDSVKLVNNNLQMGRYGYIGINISVDGGLRTVQGGFGAGGGGATLCAWAIADMFRFSIHEFAHYLLGDNNYHNGWGFWAMLSGYEPRSYMINSYERYRLGWGNVTTLSNQGSNLLNVSLTDFITTGNAYRIEINAASNQYFYVENHQKISYWDKCSGDAYPDDKGIFIMRQDREQSTDQGADWMWMISADGRYDWSVSQYVYPDYYLQGVPVFKKLGGNHSTGYEELQPIPFTYQGVQKPPFELLYIEDPVTGLPVEHVARNGFGHDAFRIGYKTEFYPWSNSNNQLLNGSISNIGVKVNSSNGTTVYIDIYRDFNEYNITYNATLAPGNWNISQNVTVNSCVTLTVQPGATLKFAANKNLTLNGVINAIGTVSQPITFTSTGSTTPGSWGTITLNGSGASYSDIQYANIEYGTEIDIINADGVDIENCNISNSSIYGLNFSGVGTVQTGHYIINNRIENSNIYHNVAVQNKAIAYFYDNVIKKTSLNHRGSGIYFGGGTYGTMELNDIRGFDWGVGIIWGAEVDAAYAGYEGRNNRITSCNTGINIYRESYGHFGDMTNPGTRKNSIYGNIYYNAAVGASYPGYPSWLWAEYNWWDDTTKYYKSSASTAYFWFPLTIDPWNGIPLPSIKKNNEDKFTDYNTNSNVVSTQNYSHNISTLVQNNSESSSNQIISPSSSDQFDSLLIGLNLKRDKKNREAKDFFISYLQRHPENQAAYVLLYHCANKNTTPEIIDYFNCLPKQASKDHQLLLAYLYLKQNNIDKAKEVNNSIIKENPNTSLSVRAKLNNFNIALYNDNDLTTAVALLNEIKSQSDLSTPIEIATAEESYYVRGSVLSGSPGSIVPKPQTRKTEEKLTSYILSQSYPNPFNPATTIHYEIPFYGFVTLKIYDVLGREVITLINQYKTQGSDDVNFDGLNLASGMYIYQLKAGNFTSTKKLLLLK